MVQVPQQAVPHTWIKKKKNHSSFFNRCSGHKCKNRKKNSSCTTFIEHNTVWVLMSLITSQLLNTPVIAFPELTTGLRRVLLLLFEVIWLLFYFSPHTLSRNASHHPPKWLLIGLGFTQAPDSQPLTLCAGAAGGFHESVQVNLPTSCLYAHLAILTHPAPALVCLSNMTEGESGLRTCVSAVGQNVPDNIISHLPHYATVLLLLKSLFSVTLKLICVFVTLVGGAAEKSSGSRGGGEIKRFK